MPRGGGRALIGETVEHVGFDKRVTLDGVLALAQAAVAPGPCSATRTSPMLCDANLERSRAGLRSHSPDGPPVLGEAPGLPGLVLTTGHFRYSILLAPIMAA